MAGLTNYLPRRAFKEPFSLCRLRAASVGKLLCIYRRKSAHGMLLGGGGDPLPRQGARRLENHPSATRGQMSGWDLLVGCRMWCPAPRGWQGSVATLGEPAAPRLLHRPGKQAGS